MHDRISRRQLHALLFNAATAPIFWFCTGWSWIWVALGGGMAALVLSLLYMYTPGGEQAPAGSARRAAGGLLLLGLLALTAWAGERSARAFPETTGQPAAACLILAAAAWAAAGGAVVPGRCAGILLRVVLALYGIVLVFSLPQLQLRELRPAGSPMDALSCGAVMLLPAAGLFLQRETVPRQSRQCWTFPAMALLGAAAAAVTGGILSPALAAEEGSFLTLAKSVSILGVIQRFEALVSGAMVISGFSLCALLLAAAREILQTDVGAGRSPRVYPAILVPVFAAAWLVPDIAGKIGAVCAICGGLLRIILQAVDQKKTFNKNEKKC